MEKEPKQLIKIIIYATAIVVILKSITFDTQTISGTIFGFIIAIITIDILTEYVEGDKKWKKKSLSNKPKKESEQKSSTTSKE